MGLTSKAGARDIAQFIPSTAAAYGVTLGDGRASDDLNGAAHYMADNLKATHGDIRQALSMYNSGRPDGFKRFPETANYVKTIMAAVGGGGKGTSSASSLSGKDGHGAVATPTSQTISHAPERVAAILQWLQARKTGNGNAALLALAGAPQDETTLGVSAAPTSGFTDGSEAPKSKSGVVTDPSGKKVASWIEPILAYAREHGWKGGINSGYRSFEDQTRIYNSGVRPAAKPGHSNHEGSDYPRGAVDVSDPEALAQILMKSPYARKLVWAGSKDPVHFSHPHNGSY